MSNAITYYLSLISPWTYLGHARLMAMAAEHGKAIEMRLVDFGVVFPATGGLPVPKRSAQRQAYRMAELKRWRTFLDIPLNLQPAHWPANDLQASQMVYAAATDGAPGTVDDAMRLAGTVMSAIWADNLNIGDPEILMRIAEQQGMDGQALLDSKAASAFEAARESNSKAAIERGVFGAPTYVFGDELLWGQDRLDFLKRAISS